MLHTKNIFNRAPSVQPDIHLGKGAQKENQKNPSMMDFSLHIHTYIKKNHNFSGFFPSDGGKLSIKTTVEKKTEKPHHFTFFGYTYIHKSIIPNVLSLLIIWENATFFSDDNFSRWWPEHGQS